MHSEDLTDFQIFCLLAGLTFFVRFAIALVLGV